MYNFSTIKQTITATINSKNPFIISNEKQNKGKITNSECNEEFGIRGTRITRFYTLFDSFDIFLKNRKNFPHCHEILIDHNNKDKDLKGRLVFDFDIQDIIVPDIFKKQIKKCILKIVEEYYSNYEVEFIWSTSKNPKKFSKHLTIKGFCFENWIEQSKIFYEQLSQLWDTKYKWIHSSKLFDKQIVRKNASLRMVGSSKIGGYNLVFDDNKYTLQDSLIRIYDDKYRNIIPMPQIHISSKINNNLSTQKTSINISSVPEYIIETLNKKFPGIFMISKIEDNFISLNRIKPYICPLSNNLHESSGAYLIIKDDIVLYGCYRECKKNDKKVIKFCKNEEKNTKTKKEDIDNLILGHRIKKIRKNYY